jgi:hypothetical protein
VLRNLPLLRNGFISNLKPILLKVHFSRNDVTANSSQVVEVAVFAVTPEMKQIKVEPEEQESTKANNSLSRPPSKRKWLQVICEDIPFINLFYDLLFDVIPCMDGVKDTLNLLGLIDALILGFSLSVFTSCDYDELSASDERFMRAEADGSLSGYYHLYHLPALSGVFIGSPSSQYAFQSYTSIICQFVSLICVLVTYLDLSNKNFSGLSKYEVDSKFRVWWMYARYSILLGFVCLIAGIWFSAASLFQVLIMKYPDYHVARTGDLAWSSLFPYGCFLAVGITIVSLIGLSILLIGLGTRATYAEQRRSELVEYHDCEAGGVYAEDRVNWETMLRTQTSIPEVELTDFLKRLTQERVRFGDRRQLGDEHLLELNLSRLGYRLQVLRAASCD